MRRAYLVELTLLLRRTHRTAVVLPMAALVLAACADVPPEYNPIDWGKGVADSITAVFSGKPDAEGPVVEPPPAEGRPYPNLATVPKPPPPVTPEARAARQREIASLAADRDAALAADRTLRAETAPPQPAPVSGSAGNAAGQAAPRPEAESLPPSTPPANPETTTAAVPPPPPVPPPAPAPVAAPRPQPPALAAAPAAALSQRFGAATFRADATTLNSASQRVLRDAAAWAVKNGGRVRLFPAEVAPEAAVTGQTRTRQQAMLQVLERASLPANRITVVDNVAGLRVDVYDVLVER